MTSSLRSLFLAHVDAARGAELASLPDLEAMLDAQLAAIAAALPDLAIDSELYCRHLAEKLAAREEPPAAVLAAIPAADLYLAAACGHGDATAIGVFRASYAPAIRAVIGQIRAPRATIDEAEQRILIMLLVGENGGRPQILGYSGRGRLVSWVRSVALRTGRRLMGVDHGDHDSADELDRLPAAVDDPQTAALRARYRDQFRTAFRAAVTALTERERLILRQYHLDGLTIDQLASLHKVDRSTSARWVKAARAAVLEETKAKLAIDLAIDPADVDSVIRLVRSQLDLTIGELFGK